MGSEDDLTAPDSAGTALSKWRSVMAWLILVLAGLFEMGWAVGLKYTEGFTRIGPSLWTIGSMIVSLGLLGVAMKSLPLGTAYAVWVGVGAVGTVILGVVLFEEPMNVIRVISVLLILAGLVGLKLGGTSTGSSEPASIVIEKEIS